MSMRRALMSGPTWMMNGDTMVGLALGSDACAEHEWGVKDLKATFKLDDSLDGVERRLVRVVPPSLVLVETPTKVALFCVPNHYDKGVDPLTLAKRYMDDRSGEFTGSDAIVTAWCEHSFGVVVREPPGGKHRNWVRELYEAFQSKDVAFWTNIGAFHTGGGLIFAIASRVSKEDLKTLLDSDLDQKKLVAEAAKLKMEDRLKAAGKHWFALTPAWKSKHRDSAFDVMFWLNPRDQNKYHSCWATVEDLILWIGDRGPIVKDTVTPSR